MKSPFTEINTPEPKAVFRFFREISEIPRPSGSEEKISNYLVDFAHRRGLEVYQDELFNVIMIKEASAGYEAEPPIILQGHMDMVCEKTADCTKDMQKEGLDLMLEGDWLSADGTTLGGDDGIAVAMALALLDDDTLQHPRLEFVCTVSEETGMEGASGIDLSVLRGRRLLNLDSEDEGIFLAGCAGGGNICFRKTYASDAGRMAGTKFAPESSDANQPGQAKLPSESSFCRVEIGGLTGGHSGSEIHKNRANAHKVLGEILFSVCFSMEGMYNAANEPGGYKKLAAMLGCPPEEANSSGFKEQVNQFASGVHRGISLVSVSGGTKDNAIPRTAEAILSIPGEVRALFESVVEMSGQAMRERFKETDPSFFVKISGIRTPQEKEDFIAAGQQGKFLSFIETMDVLTFLTMVPNGVIEMSKDVPGMTETSLNLGVFRLQDRMLYGESLLRSQNNDKFAELKKKAFAFADKIQAKAEVKSEYPAWEYVKESPLRDKLCRIYKEETGREPKVTVIHAGVECGLLSEKIPGLDAVSMGPDILDIHTPEERLSVSSAERTYRLVRRFIEDRE